MSDATIPTPVPGKKLNRLGLDLSTYRGSKTTLCAGCGHNAITERIIDAFYEMGVDPKRVIKLSGIGCSSKSPAYFLNQSHGFNSVHGRMPSVATGAVVANRKMVAIGVSGDGDTGAIGIGQFVHLMRRNLPIVYIIEQNRDAQLLQLMKLELTPERQTKLRSVLHYNGLPIDARSITDDVLAQEGFEVAKKTTARMSAGTAGGE